MIMQYGRFMQETHKVSATIVKGQTHWFCILAISCVSYSTSPACLLCVIVVCFTFCTKPHVFWLDSTTCYACVSRLTDLCRYFSFTTRSPPTESSHVSLFLQQHVFWDVVLCFSGTVTPGKDKTQKEKENKGLFGVFRKSKKKPDQVNVT